MRIDPATGGAVPALSGEELVAQVPGLEEIADFDVINFGRWPGPHVHAAANDGAGSRGKRENR